MSIQTSTLNMLEAVNAIVTKARTLHDGIPDTVVVLGASGTTRTGQKHGHFAPKSWKARSSDKIYGEILLAGESLERGAVATLGTILHELGHAYAHAADISDTSNGSRYHNAKFKEIGEQFGIELEKQDVVGWAKTTVPVRTQEVYAAEIKQLEAAIQTHRIPYGQLGEEVKPAKPKVRKMQCPECQEPLVVTKKWWEKQGNGGYDGDDDYEHGAGLYCERHEVEYEIYSEGGEET